ncbi:MAG: DnaJ domain-containing protein [Campylobacteraceae bacterium]|nr:DnaJ domain-containing protein [Campylobacteraceae bacterium]
MQLFFTQEMCAISLTDQSVYYRLQHIIDKHFPHRVGRKDKIIIFPKDEELHQRRYFLKLIAKLYEKSNTKQKPEDLKKLKESHSKILKFSQVQTGALLPHLHIKIRFENAHAIVFQLENNDRLLVSYFKNYFKDHLVQYRMRSHTLTLFPNSDLTCRRLEKLMASQKHMGWYIHFHYDISSFENFKKEFRLRFERKRRFKALHGILEEYFVALGCSAHDSFATVRHHYLELVKKYHPDKLQDKSSDLVVHYRQKFDNIQVAYEMVRTYYQEKESALTA